MEFLEILSDIVFNAKKDTLAVIPDRRRAEDFTERLISVLFGQGCARNKKQISDCLSDLHADLAKLLHVCCATDAKGSKGLADTLFERLVFLYPLLLADAAFIERSDPAARSTEEVIITYPGFYAIAAYRVAHELLLLDVPYLPRLIAEHAHSQTGIDIHPGALIGSPFAIDHGTGIVVGETCRIGTHVRIYQGVTLGALAVQKTGSKDQRHPTIEDHVILYAGSTILGGDTVIGHHSVIGGNVWLTASVPPYTMVYNSAQTRIRTPDEPPGFVI
jgi:serine O-acetyltransferase